MQLTRADWLGLAYGAGTLASVGVFGFSLASVGIPTLAFALLIADGIARPASPWLTPTISHGPRDGDKVALTFDDGPDPEVTPAVMEVLGEYEAKASFFVIARKLEAQRALGSLIVARGHELGNHSYQHSRSFNFRGRDYQQREIERANRVIQIVTGGDAKPWYRPPVGLQNPPLARVMQRLKQTVVAWSLHSRDTRSSNPQAIARRVLRRVRPGDIILFHDGHDLEGGNRPATVDALRLVLEGLLSRGLKSVTVSELLGRRG